MNAIGGEFELDPATLVGGGALSASVRPTARQELLRSGRGAIRRAVELSAKAGTWLLPSYLCESVKQPFDELGLPVQFYRIGADACIDVAHLREQVSRYQPVGLLFINYFGMPLRSDEAAAITAIKQSGCFVIEDATHGSAIEDTDAPAGHLGDVLVSSLRKYLPVPDGALLRDNRPGSLALAEAIVMSSEAVTFARQRVLAKLLRWEYLHGPIEVPESEAVFMTLFGQAEKILDASAAVVPASQWAMQVLANQNLTAVRERRRQNFQTLLDIWQSSNATVNQVAIPLYCELPAGASPFAFPIVMTDPTQRDILRRTLVQTRLFCPVLWPLPAAVDEQEFTSSYQLSASIICLPLDQRYTPHDMVDLVQRLEHALSSLAIV